MFFEMNTNVLLLLLLMPVVVFGKIDCADKPKRSLEKLIKEQEELNAMKREKSLKKNVEHFRNDLDKAFDRAAIDLYSSKGKHCLLETVYPKEEHFKGCQEKLGESEDSILTLHTNGRLGNQMSTYASLIGLADRFELKHFIYKDLQISLSKFFQGINIPVLEDRFCQVCDGKLEWTPLTKMNIQSPSYKKGHAYSSVSYHQRVNDYAKFIPQMRNEDFKIKEKFVEAAKERIDAILGSNSNAIRVGIHVRRTDMIHQVSVNFFAQAQNYFREKFKNVIFIIVSDDIKWVKENLKSKDTFIASNEVTNENDATFLHDSDNDFETGVDFAILATQCEHMIISHGTFGFWAAILANGEVFMPNNQEAKKVMKNKEHFKRWIIRK